MKRNPTFIMVNWQFIFREVPYVQKSPLSQMSAIRRKTVEGLKVGDVFTVSRSFSEQDVLCFADMTRDYNPIHFNDSFVKVKGFEGKICHGLLVAALLTEIGGQIGWLASGMNLRFVRPVYIGETVKCDFTIVEIDEGGRAKADVMFINNNGDAVLKAELSGILPGEREKKIMRNMMNQGEPRKHSMP